MPAPRNEDVPEDGDALRRDLDELARLRIPGDELRDEEAGGDVEVGGSARVIEPFGPWVHGVGEAVVTIWRVLLSGLSPAPTLFSYLTAPPFMR